MRDHQRLLAARETAQMAQMARQWIAVQDALTSSIEKLAKDIAARAAKGETISPAKLAQMTRYQDLLMQTRREIHRYIADYAEGAISQEQATMIRLAGLHAQESIAAQIGVRLNLLPVAAVERMVGLTASGSPLRELLVKAWPDAVDGLTKQLVNGVASGWNPKKTARAMRDGLDQGLDRMLVISRTETLRVYRTASNDLYLASGMIDFVKRISARQLRTCLSCLADDGHVYRVDEPHGDHPAGRCAFIPWVRGYDEPTWKTGSEWFTGLTDAQQQQVMGQKMWQQWKENPFPLQDVVKRTYDPIWGGSIGTKSLKELGA
jgi:hypothetical protein